MVNGFAPSSLALALHAFIALLSAIWPAACYPSADLAGRCCGVGRFSASTGRCCARGERTPESVNVVLDRVMLPLSSLVSIRTRIAAARSISSVSSNQLSQELRDIP